MKRKQKLTLELIRALYAEAVEQSAIQQRLMTNSAMTRDWPAADLHSRSLEHWTAKIAAYGHILSECG